VPSFALFTTYFLFELLFSLRRLSACAFAAFEMRSRPSGDNLGFLPSSDSTRFDSAFLMERSTSASSEHQSEQYFFRDGEAKKYRDLLQSAIAHRLSLSVLCSSQSMADLVLITHSTTSGLIGWS
jgi:hypothetical protein